MSTQSKGEDLFDCYLILEKATEKLEDFIHHPEIKKIYEQICDLANSEVFSEEALKQD